MSPTASRTAAEVVQVQSARAVPSLTPEELAGLIDQFNAVTDRLSRTHEALQAEVKALREELSEARGQVERSRHLALLGEMAAGIAHEVRNPLGSILLYARMLQQDLGGMPPQRQLADKIAGSVQKLEHVVGDVLAFARETRCRPVPVDAEDLIQASLSAARDDSEVWRDLDVHVSPGAACVLMADPSQAQRALVNVLRNGAEIMHESPVPGSPRRLEICVAPVTQLGPDGRGQEFIVISVRDFGPGLPADCAAKLFTPFFTTKRSGTGLGLAIVHRIMDAHQGRVSLRNAEVSTHVSGGGAIAELLWPRAE
jgi:two-component system sensor histidine kinase FlrB